MKKYLLIVLLGFGLCFALPAQKTFMPEDLWKLGLVSDPQVSPDGKTILFSIKYTDLAENKGNTDVYSIGADGRGLLR